MAKTGKTAKTAASHSFGGANSAAGPLVTLEGLEPRLLLSTITWDGGGNNTSWEDPSNWAGDVLPGPADDVVINASEGTSVQFTEASGTTSIHSLICNVPFTITGGTLDVATTLQVNSHFEIDGGTLANAQVIQGTHTGPFGTGKLGGAVTLDGSSYVDLGDPSDNHLDLGSDATIEAWVRFDALPADGTGTAFLSKDEGPGNLNKWIFGYAKNYPSLSNATFFCISSPASGPVWIQSNHWTPEVGQWYHLALVKSGNNYIFYRNGVPDGTGSTTVAVPDVGGNMLAGKAEDNFSLTGALDDVRLWSVARGAGQIQADMGTELAGDEAGLAGYWPMDGAAEYTIPDRSTGQAAGTLTNSSATVDGVSVGGNTNLDGVRMDSSLGVYSASLTAVGGHTSFLSGELFAYGAVFKASGVNSCLDVASPVALSNANVAAEDNGAVSLDAVPTMTAVSISASGGGQVFASGTRRFVGGQANPSIEAIGLGSRVDLSGLTLLAGEDYTYVHAQDGGEIDLAGAIRNCTLTVDGSGGVMNVQGVTQLSNMEVDVVGGEPYLDFASAESLELVQFQTYCNCTLSFPAAVGLADVNIIAADGAKLLFPHASSYYSSGSGFPTGITADGDGSRVDLSHLTSVTGAGSVVVNAYNGGEVDLAGTFSAQCYISLDGAKSVLNIPVTTRFDAYSNISVINGGFLTIPAGSSIVWGVSGNIFTAGRDSGILNNGILTVDGGTLAIMTDNFTNCGTLQAVNGGMIYVTGYSTDGSVAVSGAARLIGPITVTGSLTGDDQNAAQFASGATVTLDGSGTWDNPQRLEAMGKDSGAVRAGFTDNFGYGVLQLGSYTYVRLADDFDNSPGSGPEALYAESIIVSYGSILDLNGMNVYAFSVDIQGDVVGGTINQVSTNGSIGGRVTDNNTGQGLANMWITVYQGADPNHAGSGAYDYVASVRTDESGYYTVSGLNPRSYHLRIESQQAGGLRYLEADLTDVIVAEQTNTPNVDFQLRQPGMIYGYVYDSQGNPVPNAEVLVELQWQQDGDSWHTASTEATGRYELYLAPTDQKLYPVKIYEAPVLGQSGQYYAVQIAPDLYAAQVGGTRGPDFHLTLGGIIHGRVVTEDGTPVSYTEVLEPSTHIPGGEFEDPNAYTDDNGEFWLHGVPPNINVYLDTVGWDWGSVTYGDLNYAWGDRIIGPFNVGAGQTLDIPTLVARRAGAVGGTVRDTQGQPVAGALVGIKGIDSYGGRVDLTDSDGTVTDSQGRYSFPTVPAGRVWLTVEKDGFIQYYSPWVGVNSGQEVSQDIQLSPAPDGGTISGTVDGYSSIAPKNADGVILPYLLSDGYDNYDRASGMGVVAFPSNMAWTLQDWIYPDSHFVAMTDIQDGYGNYFDPGSYPAGSFHAALPAGDQTLIGYRDLAPASQGDCTLLSDPLKLHVTAGSQFTDLHLNYPSGTASVSGVLTLPSDYVVSDSQTLIYLHEVGDPVWARALSWATPDGRYTLHDLPAGNYYLFACAPGLQPVTSQPFTLAAGQAMTLNMTMLDGAVVRGMVTSAGHPVGGAIVASQATGQTAVTDSLGRYDLTGLSGGNDTLTASKPGFISKTTNVVLVIGHEVKASFNLNPAVASDPYEPDNTPGQATPITIDGAAQIHSIDSTGDVDWVTFTLLQPSSIIIQTGPDPSDSLGGVGDDTAIWLYGPDSSTRLMAFDDDGGQGLFSMIQRTGSWALAAGTYYVKVADTNGLDTISGYSISVVTQNNTPPQVTSFTPSPDGTVILDFSKKILTANVDNGQDISVVSQTPGAIIPGSIRWACNDTRLIWQPARAPTSNDIWQVSLAGQDSSDFVDMYWNVLDGDGDGQAGGDYQAAWDVWPTDMTPPIVTNFVGHAGGTAVVDFSESMSTNYDSRAIVVTDSAGQPVPGHTDWSNDHKRLTWTPSQGPAEGDIWSIVLSNQGFSGLTDLASNSLDGDGDGSAGGDYVASWVVGPGIPPTARFKGVTNGTVTIDFSQPMRTSDVQDSLYVWVTDLVDPSRKIPGTVSWSRNDTRLTWTPQLAPGCLAQWQITLASGSSGGLSSSDGVLLDGDSDGLPGGDFVRSWTVDVAAPAGLRVTAFEAAPDGTATFDFSAPVLSSLVDPAWDVVVTDADGNGVSGSIMWTDGNRRMIWQPDTPPAQGQQWTISLASNNPYDFVDIALNAVDGDGDLTPSGVIRQWNVSAGVSTSGVVMPDRYESNDSIDTATALEVSGGPQSFRGMTIDSTSDADWFSFQTDATGTDSDRVFIDADVHGGTLNIWLCEADGTVLRAGQDDPAAPSGAFRKTVSLAGMAAGTYYVEVAGEISPVYDLTIQPPPAQGQDTWTVLYYVAGDNNLDEGYYSELDHMEQLDLPSNVNVAVEFDRTPGISSAWSGTIADDWGDTRRGFLEHDETPHQLGGWLGPSTSIDEADMSSSATLAGFITWAITQRPATHYVLNLVNHGDGSNGVCFDQTSGSTCLSPEAVEDAIAASGCHFDVVVMDTCLTGMAEVATALMSHADYMVASEEATYTGSMTSQLGLLEASNSYDAGGLADAIASTTARLHPQKNQAFGHDFYTTESVIRLSAIDVLDQTIREFVQTVDTNASPRSAASQAQWDLIRQAIASATSFLNANNRDLGSFMQAVAADPGMASSIRNAASAVLAAMALAVVANYSNGGDADGLAVTLPFMLTWDYGSFASAFVGATGWDQFLNDLRVSVAGQNYSSDWAEPNNWEDLAYRLRRPQGTVTLPELTIDSPGDKDFFLIELNSTGDSGSYVQVLAVDASGNADTSWNPLLEIYEANGTRQVLQSISTNSLAQVSLAGKPAGLYYVRVSSVGGTSSGRYRMTISAPVDQSGDDWVGDNHIEDRSYPLRLSPGTLSPYVGLVTSAGGDWFTMDLSNLTNGPDGYINLVSTTGDPVTLTIYSDNGAVLGQITGAQEQYDIPQNTTGQIHLCLSGPAATTYTLTVKAPSYNVFGVPTLLQQWDSPVGDAHVAVYGPSGTMVSKSDLAVVFGKTGGITSIKLGKTSPQADLGIVVWGKGSVDAIKDARSAGNLSFIVSSLSVKTITLSHGLKGAQVNGQTLGGLTLPGDIDGDGSLSDLTALYLAQGDPKGTSVTVNGNVDGDIMASAGLASLTIKGELSNSDVVLGAASPKPAAIKLGQVNAVRLHAAGAVKSIAAVNWLGGPGASSITAASLGSLAVNGGKGIAGDMSADLGIGSASAPGAMALGSVKIAGGAGSSMWNVIGNVGPVTVSGEADGLTLRATGSMLSVKLGASHHSDFLAGIDSDCLRHAEQHSGLHNDFVNSLGLIKAFTITGIKGMPADTSCFDDSNISAANLGTVSLLNGDFASNGVYFSSTGTVKGIKNTSKINKQASWSWPPKARQVFTGPAGVINIL